MPIYEYMCQECGQHFEKIHITMPDKIPACPACGSNTPSRKVSVPGLVKETRGREGRTCCGRTERCEQPPCESDNSCHRQH